MELWVRSQDRTIFKKVGYCLEIIEQDNNCCKIKELSYELGFYQSIERALEVLDEIQDLMRSLSDSDLKIIQYEMPKE